MTKWLKEQNIRILGPWPGTSPWTTNPLKNLRSNSPQILPNSKHSWSKNGRPWVRIWSSSWELQKKHCKIDLLHELSAIGKKAFDIHENVVIIFQYTTETPHKYAYKLWSHRLSENKCTSDLSDSQNFCPRLYILCLLFYHKVAFFKNFCWLSYCFFLVFFRLRRENNNRWKSDSN